MKNIVKKKLSKKKPSTQVKTMLDDADFTYVRRLAKESLTTDSHIVRLLVHEAVNARIRG